MSKLGDRANTEVPADLLIAAESFLKAGRVYREFLKKHYRDRLFGVIYFEDDGEMVLYSENQEYTNTIKSTEIKDGF